MSSRLCAQSTQGSSVVWLLWKVPPRLLEKENRIDPMTACERLRLPRPPGEERDVPSLTRRRCGHSKSTGGRSTSGRLGRTRQHRVAGMMATELWPAASFTSRRPTASIP